MLPPRRIFRPSAASRRWRWVAGLGALSATVLLTLGQPGDLFGSAPPDRAWSAPAGAVMVLVVETQSLGDRVIQLHGLVAPERGRACHDAAGLSRDCGAAATQALAALVAARDVECRGTATDRRGRTLGICRAGSVELNASLVASGWAAADPGEARLVALQETARQARRGIWATTLP